MSGLEVNKILASIILTLIVVKVIGDIGDFLIDVNDTEMLQTAYKIEVPETFNNVSGSDDLLGSSENENEEDDLDIPAFLRRQKN